MTVEHDFKTQKDDTFQAFAELSAETDLPGTADLDFFFIQDSDEADWVPLARALEQQDFLCDWVDDDEEAEMPYLIATLSDQPLSAQSIWAAEEIATKLALEHGFLPDGWGLEA